MPDINDLEFRIPDEAELSSSNVLYCLFVDGKVLTQALPDNSLNPFLDADSSASLVDQLPGLVVGVLPDAILICGEVSENRALKSDFELVPLISYFVSERPETAQLVGRAALLLDWDTNNKFCGTCGTKTTPTNTEYNRLCSTCNRSHYPKIAPCIITLVTRGEEFLLAKNAQSRGEWYSTLAGFVEAGENLEQALRREVFEEVGIVVGETHYFGSQPWPFPAQLMVGYYAEYKSGEILVDGVEIIQAHWFTKDTLPLIPGDFSIAGQLINHYIEQL